MKKKSLQNIQYLRGAILELTTLLDELEYGEDDDFSSPLCICEDMVEVARGLMESEDG